MCTTDCHAAPRSSQEHINMHQKYSKKRTEGQLNIENLWFGCFPMPKSTQKIFWAKKKKSIFFEKKNRFFSKNLDLRFEKCGGDTPENEDYRVPHSSQEHPELLEASRSAQKHIKAPEALKNCPHSWKTMQKSWKIMKNHEKSWKIMKNHENVGGHPWTAIAKQLPGGLQKTKKTENSPHNVPKSSWNGFSTPPKHFGVSEIPSGTV